MLSARACFFHSRTTTNLVSPLKWSPSSRSFNSTSLRPSFLVVDNPFTGGEACKVKEADIAEANQEVAIASQGQRDWERSSTLEQRKTLCRNFLEEMRKDQDKIAEEITRQMGKPLKQAVGEVSGMISRADVMIDLSDKALADEVLPDDPSSGMKRKIKKEAVGVVLSLVPWNYPLLTAVNSMIPAILAGNAVILKHSPRTPLCSSSIRDAFVRAGAPAFLVRALQCDHETVSKLVLNPAISFVSFTGSVQGGRAVYSQVAQNRFIDVTLELGGKDPAYVAPDADPKAAAELLVDGACYNAGQSCCSMERVYVDQSIYPQFLEEATKLMEQYSLGDPMLESTTLGPMAQPTQPGILQRHTDQAVQLGAKILAGGKSDGRFFQPTLLADCNHQMEVMTEESFGPILPVMPVTSEEEAISLMNQSDYGLTACICTKDLDKVERLAPLIDAGVVNANRCDGVDPLLPWTGCKDTGKGVSLSSHGFASVTRLKGYALKPHP